MTRRRTRAMRGCAAAAVAALAATAAAYNDHPGADAVFPAWRAARSAEPLDGFFAPAYVWYEVHVTGPHAAEIHFRNVTDVPWHFAFWFPGWQEPDDNERVHLTPFLRTRQETKVPIRLRHGRPGLSSQPMLVHAVRRGEADEGDARGAATPPQDAAPTRDDDAWMPVRPLVADIVVRRSNLQARFVCDGASTRIAFRNPSFRDLHFAFEVPALGLAKDAGPRVHVAAESETSVILEPRVRAGVPLRFVRVTVSDFRAGEDKGDFFAEDRRADAGWFALATSDASAPLPHEKLLAVAKPLDGARARVRFRSRLRTPVRLRFSLPGWQDAARAGDVVVVPPGAETSVDVTLDRAADARIAVTRFRVVEVEHADDE